MKKITTIDMVMAMTYKSQLRERIHKIDMVMQEYGEENFYLAFSGGKDSTVLHHLLDIARPGNEIPRVYIDTGIELNAIREFVQSLAKEDNRINIIEPSTPIKQMLEKEGYPFKSKVHSTKVACYQKYGKESRNVRVYLGEDVSKNGIKPTSFNLCPACLNYQFTPDFKMKVSNKCCDRLKKDPVHKWAKEHGNKVPIIGILRAEGGEALKVSMRSISRRQVGCISANGPIDEGMGRLVY